MIEMPQRLEANNPEHIKLVRDYERAHGFDRVTGEIVAVDQKFKVTLIATTTIRGKATTIIEAKNAAEAEEKALADADLLAFEIDDFHRDMQFEDYEIEDVTLMKEPKCGTEGQNERTQLKLAFV